MSKADKGVVKDKIVLAPGYMKVPPQHRNSPFCRIPWRDCIFSAILPSPQRTTRRALNTYKVSSPWGAISTKKTMTLPGKFFPTLNLICKPEASSALTNKTLTFKIYAIQSDCDCNAIKTINSLGNCQNVLDKAKIGKWTFIDIKA